AVVAFTSTILGSNTSCASCAAGGAATRLRLKKASLSAGSSCSQAAFPTSNVPHSLVRADPFGLILVAQNSGVRTSAALIGSFASAGFVSAGFVSGDCASAAGLVSAGGLVWSWAITKAGRVIVHSNTEARKKRRVLVMRVLTLK